MRLLFARVGRTFCRQCGQEVVRETAEVVARRLGELTEGTRLLIGFEIPVVSIPASPQSSSEENGDEELLEVRNFGETTLREVKQKLTERGLSLGMKLPAARR